MIEINLLPYHLRPVKRTPVLYILGAVILVATILGIGFKWGQTRAEISSRTAELNANKQELARLEPIVQEYNALMQQKIDLSEQIETIQEIVSDRIIWSRQLWNINRLALENLWYDSIRVQVKNVREMQRVWDERQQQYVMREVTVKRSFLVVEGYVIPGDDGEAKISPMMIASAADPEFASQFQINNNTIGDTEFEDFPVRQFTLEYLIGDFGEPETEPAN